MSNKNSDSSFAKDMKKRFLIILIPIIALILFIIISPKISEEPKKEPSEFDNMVSFDIFNENVNIIIEKNEDLKKEEIYVENNNNEYVFEDEKITIDTGNNLVLSSSTFKLNKDYTLVELLIGLGGHIGYLNDAQLSTSYEYAKMYSKRWLLIDNETKEEFFIFQNDDYDLILNSKIVDENIEVDYASSLPNQNKVDHYTFPIEDLIASALGNNDFNYKLYSIYTKLEEPNFTVQNYIRECKYEEDLNNDGKKDSIELIFYKGSKKNENGFTIIINDSALNNIFLDVSSTIRIIDLDKSDNFKELLFVSDSDIDGYYNCLILSYDGTKIIKTFSSDKNLKEFRFETTDNYFEYNDLTFNENKEFPIVFYESDSVQRWVLNGYLKFNKSHQLVFSTGENGYFEAVNISETTNLIDVVLYESKDYKSNKVIAPVGSKIEFIGTTLNFWVVVKYNEDVYYIPLDNDGQIHGAYAFAYQMFDGLAIYD